MKFRGAETVSCKLPQLLFRLSEPTVAVCVYTKNIILLLKVGGGKTSDLYT